MTRIVLLLLHRRFVPMSESWDLPFIIIDLLWHLNSFSVNLRHGITPTLNAPDSELMSQHGYTRKTSIQYRTVVILGFVTYFVFHHEIILVFNCIISYP